MVMMGLLGLRGEEQAGGRMGGAVEGGCRGIRTLEMLGTAVEKVWSLHGYGVRVEWLGRYLLILAQGLSFSDDTQRVLSRMSVAREPC